MAEETVKKTRKPRAKKPAAPKGPSLNDIVAQMKMPGRTNSVLSVVKDTFSTRYTLVVKNQKVQASKEIYEGIMNHPDAIENVANQNYDGFYKTYRFEKTRPQQEEE